MSKNQKKRFFMARGPGRGPVILITTGFSRQKEPGSNGYILTRKLKELYGFAMSLFTRYYKKRSQNSCNLKDGWQEIHKKLTNRVKDRSQK
jgi:hypothetical protein